MTLLSCCQVVSVVGLEVCDFVVILLLCVVSVFNHHVKPNANFRNCGPKMLLLRTCFSSYFAMLQTQTLVCLIECSGNKPTSLKSLKHVT